MTSFLPAHRFSIEPQEPGPKWPAHSQPSEDSQPHPDSMALDPARGSDESRVQSAAVLPVRRGAPLNGEVWDGPQNPGLPDRIPQFRRARRPVWGSWNYQSELSPQGPRAPGQGMGGTERGGQNNLEGGKTDVTFLVSHLPGNSGQSQDVSDHRLSLHTGKLRSERHHPPR